MRWVFEQLPFVSFKVLQLDSQHVFLIVGEHVNIFISQPELLAWVSETVLVVDPVPVEVFSRLTKIISALDDLELRHKLNQKLIHFDWSACALDDVTCVFVLAVRKGDFID